MGDWPLSYCTLDYSPLFGLPETLHLQVAAAAEAGFTHVTPDLFTLRAYAARGHTMAELAERLAKVGLAAFDIAGTNVSGDRDASRRELEELAGYARDLGAPWLQSRITGPLDDAATLDTYRECAAIADSFGVGLALEFSPFTPVDSLERARTVLDAVRSAAPHQGIVVDSWHLARSDGFASLQDLPVADLAVVQLDDAEPGSGSANSDTMHRRALPGEGDLGLGQFVAALRAIGYTGVVTVEVLSATLRTLPIDEYAGRVYAATSALLASSGERGS